MNEDYLWDKSGEAEPEIERLERTLGSLRFRPEAHPLQLPATTRPWFRLNFSPALAAAAALVIMLSAGALWLGLQRTGLQTVSGPGKPPGPIEITSKRLTPAPQDAPAVDPARPGESSPGTSAKRRQELTMRQGAGSTAREQIARRERQAMREREAARRGEIAKEQLIRALHIASDKLNTVQRKIQDGLEQGPAS